MYSVSLMFALTLMFGATAHALVVTFDKYVKFAGTPALPTFDATITDGTYNSISGVFIYMDHPVSTDADIVFSWFFNIVPPIPAGVTAANATFLNGIQATGQGPTPGVQLSEDVAAADGDGRFDLVFTWPNSGAGEFVEGAFSRYFVSGLTASQFLALSTPQGGQGPYYSAVEQSAWWGQGASPVPEPYTLLLLGLGLVGVAGVRRFRK
jgi:hypothetical protein